MDRPYPDDASAPADVGRARDRSLTLQSALIALVAIPYLGAAAWLVVGGELSSHGQWPHWRRDEFLGFVPHQGWDGLMALTFMCFPIPLVVFLGAIVSAVLGLMVVRRRPLALLWVVPEVLLVVTVVGCIAWLVGRGHRWW